jgi:hypothetical protein
MNSSSHDLFYRFFLCFASTRGENFTHNFEILVPILVQKPYKNMQKTPVLVPILVQILLVFWAFMC